MKKIFALTLLIMLMLVSSACGPETATTVEEVSPAVYTESGSDSTAMEVSTSSEDNDAGLGSDSSYSESTAITLAGTSISADSSNITIAGSTATITAAGAYSISGTLDEGQIIVDTEDEGKVELILNGASIANSTSAPIYVVNADKAVIILAEGSANTVTDGASYVFADADTDEPNAAIFSKSDLTIRGSGSLTVNANYNNGIASKDELKVNGGTITVNAVNDGIKGKDAVIIQDGIITITAGSDGIQSSNDSDAEKGTVEIEGGTLNITSGLDGIQAETNLSISAGEITINSGGGSANAITPEGWGNPGGQRGMENIQTTDTTIESAKGLKAGAVLTISGGTINIDSSDDSLHSNDSLVLNGGVLMLTSGDDGLHADSNLEINGGNLTITKSYEGIESANITINDGTIYVTASDDGFNVAGGSDGSAVNGRPGQGNFTMSGNYYLTINGGDIVIDANGDGLDSNGSIEMTAGKVIVYGPTNSGNGPLDYMGTFNISGGFLAAVGSSGMAQSASASSTQYSVLYNYDQVQAGGTLLHLENQNGTDILTLLPGKEYQSLLISSPDLEDGMTYSLYSGGSSSGTEADGLYTGGTYSGGSLVTNFTISSIVTTEGAAGSMMGGGRGGGQGRPGGGQPDGGGGMQPPGQ